MCGGDPNRGIKQQAIQDQSQQANNLNAIGQQNNAVTQPFFTNEVQNGDPNTKANLDYAGGTNARAFAPAKGSLLRGLGNQGSSLPSGFASSQINNFNANRARAYDDSVMGILQNNQNTKNQAASQLNPLPYFGGAQSGYNSVVNAPAPKTNSSFWGGLLNSAVQGASSAAMFA